MAQSSSRAAQGWVSESDQCWPHPDGATHLFLSWVFNPDPKPSTSQSGADLDIVVASRSAASFEAAKRDRPELGGTRFVACDIDDAAALASALEVRPLGFGALGIMARDIEDAAALASTLEVRPRRDGRGAAHGDHGRDARANRSMYNVEA